MAIAYDNSARGFSLAAANNVSTASFAIGAGSNRYLLVGVINSDGSPAAPTAVKWGGSGGTAMTQIGTTLTVATFARMTWWELKNPTSQTSTVHVQWAANQGEKGVVAVAYTGVDQTTPKGTVVTATGSGATITVAAGSVSGDIVVDFGGFLDTGGGNRTLTVGANQTSRQEIEGTDLGFDGCGTSQETATGTSTTMSWTISSASVDGWGILAVALKAASGGATITGTGAITLGPIAVSGSGSVEGTVTGTGAVTLGAVTVAGTAEREVTDVGGAVALVLPAITVSGSQGAGTETGTGAIALGAVTVAGTAEREIPGSGAITLGSVALAGSGTRATAASGAITLGELQLSAQGLLVIDGDGAITLGALQVSGFDAAPVTQTAFAGGFFYAFERDQARRRKRRRELEEAEEAAQQLKDAVDREIAELLQEQERKAEFERNIERLKRLVGEFADREAEAAMSERVRGALAKAQAQESVSAYLALQRELERMLEEEEFAVLMMLAND